LTPRLPGVACTPDMIGFLLWKSGPAGYKNETSDVCLDSLTEESDEEVGEGC
jgi:hypothetical protein